MHRYEMNSKTNCVTEITKVAFLLTYAVSVATCGYLQATCRNLQFTCRLPY